MKGVRRGYPLDEVAAAVEQLQQGASFAAGRVTLTAGATSTTVPFRWCSPRSNVHLTPNSATAGAATGPAGGNVYAIPAAKQFVVHHDNAVATDRHFAFHVTNTDSN